MTNYTTSHLYREIHEQPDILRRLLTQEQATITQLAAAIRERDISHVVIAARGTSDNAGRYAKYLLGAMNHLPVALATPSLFTIYQQPPTFGNALVLGISQSGKSPDIVSVLAEGRKQGALTAAITNTPKSDLGDAADFVIDIHAGQEQSVAATKSYTSELAAIALLSATLAEDGSMLDALMTVPDTVAVCLGMNGEIARMAERYRYMRYCAVIGRGYNYATAFEVALKLKELTYTIAEPYSSADFLHGPLALIEHGFPVLVIAPTGVMLDETRQFIQALKEREAEVIVVSDDQPTLEMGRIQLHLTRSVPEWLSPIQWLYQGSFSPCT